jgi:hypothetical protein
MNLCFEIERTRHTQYYHRSFANGYDALSPLGTGSSGSDTSGTEKGFVNYRGYTCSNPDMYESLDFEDCLAETRLFFAGPSKTSCSIFSLYAEKSPEKGFESLLLSAGLSTGLPTGLPTGLSIGTLSAYFSLTQKDDEKIEIDSANPLFYLHIKTIETNNALLNIFKEYDFVPVICVYDQAFEKWTVTCDQAEKLRLFSQSM